MKTTNRLSSRTVCWSDFHHWCRQWAGPQHDDAPMPGTLAWFELDDTDPRKWAAVLTAAQHHVLRVEGAQEAMAQASQAISGMAKWSDVADDIRSLQEFRRDHPWARRGS